MSREESNCDRGSFIPQADNSVDFAAGQPDTARLYEHYIDATNYRRLALTVRDGVARLTLETAGVYHEPRHQGVRELGVFVIAAHSKDAQ